MSTSPSGSKKKFAALVTALRERLQVAQHENWTPTFASFSTDRYSLPLGIQVTVIGSADDYLLALRDRMLAQPDLLREYDKRKLRAAARGAAAYWDAKERLSAGVARRLIRDVGGASGNRASSGGC